MTLRSAMAPNSMSALEEVGDLVVRWGLEPHPEGGFFRETFRSAAIVEPIPGLTRAASTAIYFLLPAGQFSAFHRVASDEVWHHYDGDPVDLHSIDAHGAYLRVRIGRRYRDGDVPQHVVRAGVWQAAQTVGDRWALCGCTVAPGFDFADFEMPSRGDLVARFPEHRAIVQALTRPARPKST